MVLAISFDMYFRNDLEQHGPLASVFHGDSVNTYDSLLTFVEATEIG